MPLLRRLILVGTATLGVVLTTAGGAGAQVVRGNVRGDRNSLPLERAQVAARDTAGVVVALATTDAFGNYTLPLPPGLRLQLEVKRLGYEASRVNVRALAATDTVDLEHLMTEVAAVTAAIEVVAEPSLNDRRLLEAERRGWKVFAPELVMRHRETAKEFTHLLQSIGAQGLILPQNGAYDCIRATRNNRCLTYVVDNQVWGTTAFILPSDVYFIAILGASEARAQFGDRAPFGAIAVYTRSRLDRVQPPRPEPKRPKGTPPR